MKEAFIHDIVTLGFLIPFSILSIAEVVFHYTVYPLFLTHAFIAHMLFDLTWIHRRPHVLTSYHKLIKFHHLVVLSFLVYPLFRPWDSRLVAVGGLVEIDTTLLLLKRVFKGHWLLRRLYMTSNLIIRVWYVTLLSFLYWYYTQYENVWVRLHIMSAQAFVNLFSFAICIVTFTKEIKRKLA